MDDNTLAVVVSFGALAVSVLGPFFTGIITLRQSKKEREAKEREERISHLRGLLYELIRVSGQFEDNKNMKWDQTHAIVRSFGIPEVNKYLAGQPAETKLHILTNTVSELVGLHITKLMEE